MNSKTKRLTTTGVLIALGTILSFIKVYELPYGGSITLASMVPIIIIGYKYGVKWGIFSGFIGAIIQAILGATASQAFAGMYDSENVGKSVLNIILMALLDYIVAFTVLGLSGMFKNKIKNDTAAFALGGGVVCLLRFVAHFLSGWILWGSYAEWFFTEKMNNSFSQSVLGKFSGQSLAIIYSAVYNGSYMLPELIITVVACLALISVKPVRKLIVNPETNA
ncbi:MAG: energy-coupled thiamine transporter ThiT [Eubacterium sp.]|nr:energy-coupled thiamine transporter ThiT [Eubacterium sp.]MBR4241846.1 energy-coupled thiamine transporter ThiT [Eubacterium sp.]MBR7060151.1 energy-coupled thiamine transporter ThiT [Eubacterium sp.]